MKSIGTSPPIVMDRFKLSDKIKEKVLNKKHIEKIKRATDSINVSLRKIFVFSGKHDEKRKKCSCF
jgi:hypothetical protein